MFHLIYIQKKTHLEATSREESVWQKHLLPCLLFMPLACSLQNTFLKYLFLFSGYQFCLHVSMCTTSMDGAHEEQKSSWDTPELELQMIMSHYVGVRN